MHALCEVTETNDEQLLRRCWDFEIALDLEFSPRLEDVGDGFTAVLDPELPQVWDSNYLIVERPDAEAEAVAAKAEQVLDGLGMGHRSVYTREPQWGAPLADALVKLGWEREDDLYLLLRREPDRPAEVAVEQVSLDDVAQVNRATILAEKWGSEELAVQLHERDRKLGKVCRDRWFAAHHEGEIAACCRLMQYQGLGKVEDVATLEAGRNRGLARAVVLEAIRCSRADRDELTFIVALADDWPRQLYERLGFDSLGIASSARRRPE